MAKFDDSLDRHFIDSLNSTSSFDGRLELIHGRIDALKDSTSVFASFHFDPVVPMEFSEEEKQSIERFLVNGGFLLLIENNYFYSQDEFRKKRSIPVYDFFAKELAEKDPAFRVVHADQSHPMYNQFHQIKRHPAVINESKQNPQYRGDTLLFYKDRLAGCVLSFYALGVGDQFVGLQPPYTQFRLLEACYQLMENIYLYSTLH